MTTNFATDRPEEPDEPGLDPDDLADLLLADHLLDSGIFDSLDGEPGNAAPRRLEIEFVTVPGSTRLRHVHTKGLWWLGLPELCISPPGGYDVDDTFGWGPLAMLFAVGLLDLGRRLIFADSFDISPYHGEISGQQVRMWLGRPEPVTGDLCLALDDQVDTVLRVHASLWQQPPE
jgi:hypothetical protein